MSNLLRSPCSPWSTCAGGTATLTAKPKAPGNDWLSRMIKEPGSESFRISLAARKRENNFVNHIHCLDCTNRLVKYGKRLLNSSQPVYEQVTQKDRELRGRLTVISCNGGFIPKWRRVPVEFKSWNLRTVGKKNIWKIKNISVHLAAALTI